MSHRYFMFHGLSLAQVQAEMRNEVFLKRIKTAMEYFLSTESMRATINTLKEYQKMIRPQDTK